MKDISVIIPAYNEEQAIGSVLDDIQTAFREQNLEGEIIVVDDGSTDSTPQIVREKGAVLVQHEKNTGYGAALKTGVKASKNETLVIIDADGTYPVESIPVLLAQADGCDMVVGSRSGKNVHLSLVRMPVKWFLRILANYLTDTKIPDLNSGMRILKKGVLLKYLYLLPSGFSFTSTITLSLLTNNHTIKYIPIDYYKRKGRSKIRSIKDTLKFLQLIIRTVMYFNPLKVFLPISLFFIIAGVAWTIYQIVFFRNISTLSILIIISGIQIAVIGMLGDLIVTKMKADK